MLEHKLTSQALLHKHIFILYSLNYNITLRLAIFETVVNIMSMYFSVGVDLYQKETHLRLFVNCMLF